jgi:hypothetical protein
MNRPCGCPAQYPCDCPGQFEPKTSPLAWLHANSHYVELELNPQRRNYRTVAEELAVLDALEATDAEDLPPEVRAQCLARDTLVGHYSWYHFDVEVVLALALALAFYQQLNGGGS